MNNNPQQITVGWMRSDGDLDVAFVVHLKNINDMCEPDNASRVLEAIKSVAKIEGLTILNREDVPDVIELQ